MKRLPSNVEMNNTEFQVQFTTPVFGDATHVNKPQLQSKYNSGGAPRASNAAVWRSESFKDRFGSMGLMIHPPTVPNLLGL